MGAVFTIGLFPKNGQSEEKFLRKLIRRSDRLGMEVIDQGDQLGEFVFRVKGF